MERTIQLDLKNNTTNDWNVERLNEFLKQVGAEMDVKKTDAVLQLNITYSQEKLSLLKKRNAGRKYKHTTELTYGDVEKLLKTKSVKEIAQMANISQATCYRRIEKLKKYQNEAEKETEEIFKGLYKKYQF